MNLPAIDDSISGLSRYKLLRQYIDTGDCLEFKGVHPISRMIRWRTGEPVNHTAMCFKYVLQGDSEPRITISEAVDDGVQPSFLSRVLDGYGGKVYLVRLHIWNKPYKLDLAKAMLSLEGINYDYTSIFKLLFKRVKMSRHKLFCSESIQAAAIKAKLVSEDCNGGVAIVPGELHKLGLYRNEHIRIY